MLCVGVQKLIAFVNETCSPRLHWAKAGWPRYLSCFDGSVAYPQTWCDFGCAVQVSSCCHYAEFKAACASLMHYLIRCDSSEMSQYSFCNAP